MQSEEESNEIKRKLTRHICERHAEGEGCIAAHGIGLIRVLSHSVCESSANDFSVLHEAPPVTLDDHDTPPPRSFFCLAP